MATEQGTPPGRVYSNLGRSPAVRARVAAPSIHTVRYFGQYIHTATPNMATVAKCARNRHGRDRAAISP
jgi:hypothetical protein